MFIILNLSKFFNDHKSKARLYVNSEMKKIYDIEQKITKIFNINDFYLLIGNCYLPSTEDIRIIREDEIIIVEPTEKNKSYKHINQINLSKSNKHESKTETKEKRHKNKEMDNVEEIQVKKSEEHGDKSLTKVVKIDTESHSQQSKVGQVNIVRTIHIKNESEKCENSNYNDTSLNECKIDSVKKKKERHRKYKKSTFSPAILDSQKKTIVPNEITAGSVQQTASHIRFKNELDESEQEKTDVPKEKKYNFNQQISENTLSESVIFDKPLVSKPSVGNVIAFKIFRLNENYCPEISQFITGTVLKYDNETGEITLKLMDGKEQCHFPEGKFSLTGNENVNPKQYITNWNDIMEPHLIRS